MQREHAIQPERLVATEELQRKSDVENLCNQLYLDILSWLKFGQWKMGGWKSAKKVSRIICMAPKAIQPNIHFFLFKVHKLKHRTVFVVYV